MLEDTNSLDGDPYASKEILSHINFILMMVQDKDQFYEVEHL